jgi:hypothetical protein
LAVACLIWRDSSAAGDPPLVGPALRLSIIVAAPIGFLKAGWASLGIAPGRIADTNTAQPLDAWIASRQTLLHKKPTHKNAYGAQLKHPHTPVPHTALLAVPMLMTSDVRLPLGSYA